MDWRLEGADSDEGMDEFLEMMSEMNSMLAKLEGVEFDVELYRDGRFKDVNGLDEIISNLNREFPDLHVADRNELIEIIQQVLGERSIKTNLELITNIFPGKMVETGDSWSKKHFSESGHNVTFTTLFTLSEVNKDYMLLSGDMEVSSDSSNSDENRKTKSSYDGGGTITMKLHPESGWIKQVDSKFTINGEMTFDYGEEMNVSDNKMYMQINQSVKINN